MDNAPCKDCKDRTIQPNCHMTCEKYLEAVKKHKEKVNGLRKLRQCYDRPKNKFHFQGFHNWE